MSARPVERPMSVAETAGVWCMRLSEGPLPTGQDAEFAEWLAADEIHRTAFEEAVATWREIEGAETDPEFLPLRLEALKAVRRSRNRPSRLIRLWTPWAAAASLLLVLGFGGLWWSQRPLVYETGVGERRVVVLADGSKVSLDAMTRVDVRYRGDRRALVLEKGRAKFDVAKDPLRPFSVAAGKETVVATGTQFSVELLERQVHVVLYEGHVAVLGPSVRPGSQAPGGKDREVEPPAVRLAGQAYSADQVLTPGRELVVAQAGSVATVAPTDPARTLAWEGGQLVFVDEPLASAVERENRYSDDKLVIGDHTAGEVRINGVFTAGDTRAFIDGVTAVFPIRASEQNGHTVLVSKGR